MIADSSPQDLDATVGHHHASTLRWDGFSGDGELADGEALLRWLADREQVRREL